MTEITQEEITELLVNRGLTIEKVIDAVIDVNALVGVGLVSLSQTVGIYTLLNSKLRKPGLTQEEANQIIQDHIKSRKYDSRN